MAEQMAKSSDHTPNDSFFQVYSRWADGGWGSILTGNVQVDSNYLGGPNDLAPPRDYNSEKDAAVLQRWKKYADSCQKHGTPAIVQLCHPGRQSPLGSGDRGLFTSAMAPSPIPLNIGDGLIPSLIRMLVFPTPREMTVKDIERVTRQFVDGARLMADAGFSGIEFHGAHGYLIDQFLSPKTNHRTDAYGGTPEKRAKFLLDIIVQTRKAVPSNFCIGIKLNSADHDSSYFEDVMTQIGLVVAAGIDFIEISGGTYETPKMMDYDLNKQQPISSRTAAREAFFLDFSREARKRYPNVVLMLTGGFRTRQGAEAAVKENACDLIGIGRPACVDPKIAHLILDDGVKDEDAQLSLKKAPVPFFLRLLPLRVQNAGAETTNEADFQLYYVAQIQRLAKGLAAYAPAI
ncbi:hypothetical protein Plec18167_002785 [Paecilomyces lecythidis]|uniref:NADH:flavin oxidoreductase/NADH oxidase N-terminal domain-containing protein n=1 Tax=Paecilomyces lecythidis TaxID=3004212 RepID=A0ABR3Y292_9EURO